MSSVVQLVKRLDQPSSHTPIEGVTLRNFQDPADAEAWIELRRLAFGKEKIGVRHWSRQDFEHELINRSWWKPQRMWFAEAQLPEGPLTVGSVTIAQRGADAVARTAVHWLMVLPRWRRRGVGRLLIAAVESYAWNAGHREVWLETHAGWQAAAAFYERLGYVPVHAA